MKNIRNILFTSLLSLSFILVSFESRASENLEIVLVENSRMMRMEVNNPSIEVIDVFLYNSNNNEIFSERVELGDTFENQFDFTNLKNGSYTLVSEVANMRVNRVLEVNNTQVDLIESYYSFLPVFAQNEGMLKVHYVNSGGSDLAVSIQSNTDVIFDAFYDNGDMIFSNVYSLDNLASGTYKFHISSQGEFYTHEFKID